VSRPRGVLLVGLAAVAAAASAGACGSIGFGVESAAPATVDLTCTLSPGRPVVGPATLSCALRDAGRPVDDATVRVVGLMTHPGMAPVPVRTTARGGGRYDGVFSFTMPGDWALVVTAQLTDGRRREVRVGVPDVRAGQ
jgi:hypothetical protein